MKKTLLTLLSVLFCAITFAQSVPQGINYQAVARDVSGTVLMNQALTIQFSVNFYWSSTETGSYGAWGQSFDNGYQFDGFSNNGNYVVRAVRAF